jgi:hypothetical protein
MVVSTLTGEEAALSRQPYAHGPGLEALSMQKDDKTSSDSLVSGGITLTE